MVGDERVLMDTAWLIPIFSLLIASLALCATVWVLLRLRSHERLSAESIARLKDELLTVNGAAIGVGQRLIAVEKKLKISLEKQNILGMGNVDTQPYDQAASMAEQGADIQQLVDQCGLLEAEASLLSLLKSSSKQS